MNREVNNALEGAVRSVLYAGAISALAVAPAGMAQEEGDQEDAVELGEQVVTGSRIKRIDVEQARPVVVITREEIELSGQDSVADVLRNSPVNTFGSSREVSGDSWAGQAGINLHGIGSGRSLVLLDGRRLPRSPVTENQFINLNIIPLAAVDRIEILTDSASAIYGSDAIAGVINIILRKDYDGMEVSAALHRPTREGADVESGGLTIGGSTGRGRFLFSGEFRNKGHIASADRFYSRGDPGYDAGPADYPSARFPATWYAWENTDNISGGGNSITTALFPSEFPSEFPARPQEPFRVVSLSPSNCADIVDPDTGERLLAGPYISRSGQEFCGFDYTAFAWETADLKRASTFLNADYELSPYHALRFASIYSGTDSAGRFAPAVGNFFVPAAAEAGLKENFDDYAIPYPQFVRRQILPRGPGYLLNHRFVGLGNRDFSASETFFANNLMAYGTVGMFDYELAVQHVRYDFREDSCCYAKRFTATQFVAEGRYNPFDPLNPANEAAYNAITANSNRDSRADARTYSATVSFEMFDAPAGPVGWAAGFEYWDEEFYDIYDPLSAGGDLIGSAGNTGEGERAIKAGFAEVLVPVLSNLEVSAAARWDSYDDSAGEETSLYASALYQPTDWLLLRASWGEGFRAANMDNLYGARSGSADGATDLVACRASGTPPEDCVEDQYFRFTGGNPLLLPELSDSYNLGFVVDWEDLAVRVDYWSIDLENGIGLATLQGLIESELEGQCFNTGRTENTIENGLPAEIIQCSPGNVLKRAPGTGMLLEAEAGWGNTFRQNISGVDVQVGYDLETATAGDFTFSVYGARILRYRIRSRSATEWSSSLGEGVGNSARPKYSAVGLIRWSYTDHTLSLYARHIAGYIRSNDEQGVFFEASPHTEFDLTYLWDVPWGGEISLGVLNATDEDPELDRFASPRPAVYNLYSLDGRVPYVSYRHFF